jgi:hypothetical protein
MKNSYLLTLLIGASITAQSTFAGEWIPSAKDKTPIEECPDIGGNISVGYDTDYVWKGIRFSRDAVWGDVNYTFESLPFSPNIGAWHLSSLGSGGPLSNDAYGDEFNAYAGISLPSVLGFDTGVAYTWYTFPTAGIAVDSTSSITFSASRALIAGVEFSYDVDYFTGQSALSAWFHTFGLSKAFEITDWSALEIGANIAYNDDLWGTGSGWNHYAITAGLPIALNCRATLTPYITYSGTPDGWTADGVPGIGNLGGGPNQGANANDVFYGGVSVSVDF